MKIKKLVSLLALAFLFIEVNAQTPDSTRRVRAVVKSKREVPANKIIIQPEKPQDSVKIDNRKSEIIPAENKKKTKKRIR